MKYAFGFLLLRAKISETLASASESSTRRRSYEILGQEIGLACLCSVMGIGKNRFQKVATGLVDGRFACNGSLARSNPMARSVDNFMIHLHGSVAEVLPTGSECSIQ